MHGRFAARAAAIIALLFASPAAALCSGESLAREYREADLVIRARLVAETNVHDDAPSPGWRRQWGDYSPVVLYRLTVGQVFKGRPGPHVALFQERSSGRFEIGWDEDYLLFLHYIRPHPGRPAAARGATYVRYACGQSKRWREVAPAVRMRLGRLAERS